MTDSTLRELYRKYLTHLKVVRYSPHTVKLVTKELGYFLDWCMDRDITEPLEITQNAVKRYQRHLYYYRQERNGEPLSFHSQNRRISIVKGFGKWLSREEYIPFNPAADIEFCKTERRLPKYVLTDREAEGVLNSIDVTTLSGIRDRAIIETLYSTGMRRQELQHLQNDDLDKGRGILVVHKGKGGKGRTVPIGDRALLWIQKYLLEVRPYFLLEPDENWLFIGQKGQKLSSGFLTKMVGQYVRAADIGKTGACHLFRHTAATLMLENGADIRFVQEMLGHVSLLTTQIYTRVSIRKLKEVHTLTHPAGFKRPFLDQE